MKGSMDEVIGNLFWILFGLAVVIIFFSTGDYFFARMIGMKIESQVVYWQTDDEGYICNAKNDDLCNDCEKKYSSCEDEQTVDFEEILAENKYVNKILIKVDGSKKVKSYQFIMYYDQTSMTGSINYGEDYEKSFDSIKIKSITVSSPDPTDNINFFKVSYWLAR